VVPEGRAANVCNLAERLGRGEHDVHVWVREEFLHVVVKPEQVWVSFKRLAATEVK
jgi:hypothetical protein